MPDSVIETCKASDAVLHDAINTAISLPVAFDDHQRLKEDIFAA